jgi:hypothetical protein
MSSLEPSADKSGATTETTGNRAIAVTGEEIDEWVQLVRELFANESERDVAGGIPPKTIAEQATFERNRSTVSKHLKKDYRVRAVQGIAFGGKAGGRRTSFVPREADR